MTPLTLQAYLGPYFGQIAHQVETDGEILVEIANDALAAAEADGVEILVNPATGTHIAGSGNGGVRPPDSPVGASRSAHKRGRAIDIYDPSRGLARWSLSNLERLKLLGIRAVEDPRWTPSWCHWQDEPLASGNVVFIPNATPPLAEALPEQKLTDVA